MYDIENSQPLFEILPKGQSITIYTLAPNVWYFGRKRYINTIAESFSITSARNMNILKKNAEIKIQSV